MIKRKDLIYKNDLLYYKDKLFTDQSIDNYGTKYWYKEGITHRDNDLPALEFNNGDKIWIMNNFYHRINGPAIEFIDGTKVWYYNNEFIDCKDQKEFEKIIKLKIFE